MGICSVLLMLYPLNAKTLLDGGSRVLLEQLPHPSNLLESLCANADSHAAMEADEANSLVASRLLGRILTSITKYNISAVANVKTSMEREIEVGTLGSSRKRPRVAASEE